jgi:hypothetical protein
VLGRLEMPVHQLALAVAVALGLALLQAQAVQGSTVQPEAPSQQAPQMLVSVEAGRQQLGQLLAM